MLNSLDSLNSPTIILGSSSVYRQALLARLHIQPICVAPDIDETPKIDETAAETAQRLAHEKAHAAFEKYLLGFKNTENNKNIEISEIPKKVIVIGSDQVLLHQGQKLGKPMTHANAVLQLKELRNQQVTFFTALTMSLFDTESHRSLGAYHACDQTHVKFRNYSDEIIEQYLQAEKPYDCAGAAKSEGLGLILIERIDNQDPSALIGLPLIEACNGLQQLGYHFFK